jgi:hypothetical protein
VCNEGDIAGTGPGPETASCSRMSAAASLPWDLRRNGDYPPLPKAGAKSPDGRKAMPLQTQVDSSAGSYPHAEKLEYQVFPHPWERTDLVVRTVFKIAEVVARRLVGSIPTRSRQNHYSTRNNSEQWRFLTRRASVGLTPGGDDAIQQVCRVVQHGRGNVRFSRARYLRSPSSLFSIPWCSNSKPS